MEWVGSKNKNALCGLVDYLFYLFWLRLDYEVLHARVLLDLTIICGNNDAVQCKRIIICCIWPHPDKEIDKQIQRLY
jgi:hypothetical protein